MDRFKAIYDDNKEIGKSRGKNAEADTRANIIDRLIHEVLEWPRDNVRREPFANPGFIDYEFKYGNPLFLMEAKKEGIAFSLQYQKNPRPRLKIGGSLISDPEVRKAVEQVQRYCSDTGTRFGVVTNGFSFIIFRAVTFNVPWKSGNAIVFRDYKDIIKRFTEFWNLLSYEAVIDGLLESAFRDPRAQSRSHYRPMDEFVGTDATYGRNPFSNALKPFVDRFFGDIASQDTIDVLENCYVYSGPIKTIDESLEITIRDDVPEFAKDATQLHTSERNQAGQLAAKMDQMVSERSQSNQVVLIMGGIGSGKSTFCRRFFRVVAPELVSSDGPGILIFLNFIGAPEEAGQLDDYLWETAYRAIRNAAPELDTRETMMEVFRKDLSVIKNLYSEGLDRDNKINDKLADWFTDYKKFTEASLIYCASSSKFPIVVFDNVDQLRHEAQVHLFTAAQRFALSYNCLSILVLREESYNAALLKRHLTASGIRPYHLSSPGFNDLIRLRIDFAVNAASSAEGTEADISHGYNYSDVANLLGLMRSALLGRNKNIIRLVESVAYGNMRLALDLFNSFITSGATDMNKIINTIRESGGYTVPFHEFAKSVMLGDYRFYKENRSLIFNLFYVSNSINSSHFTSLRMLKYLMENGASQDGFISIQIMLSSISDVFGNEDDCKDTLLRLIAVDRQLVELDTRRPDSLDGATGVRVTASGRYYLNYLVNSFAYCDIVWQDTPFNSRGVSNYLRSTAETEVLDRRFDRTMRFLDHLKNEEEEELKERGLGEQSPSFVGPFMPKVIKFVQNEMKSKLPRQIP